LCEPMMMKIRLLSIVLGAFLGIATPVQARWPMDNWPLDRWFKPKPPALVFADPTPGSKKTLTRPQDLQGILDRIASDANNAVQGPSLIVITHGWNEKADWYKDMALAIRDRLDGGPWICAWYDWRAQAKRSSPIDATQSARLTYGPALGTEIVEISKQWKHVHLIGHSSGCWLNNEAAKIISKETKASIHLTLLDAYIPPFWHQEELGCVVCQPNTVCWVEHYFSRDAASELTQKPLSNALNVDLSAIDPGPNKHRFPFHWYQATVVGRFTEKPYIDKPLFTHVGEIEYGIDRSLEAGAANWEFSRKLQGGNEPIMVIAK
jgi:hypothetical protein